MNDLRAWYRGKNVLITGGLGHLGSNLAIALVEMGAQVTAIDNRMPGCGANDYNLTAVAGAVRHWDADIAQVDEYSCVLASADVIFNLAGEVSHIHSMLFPERDLAINLISQMHFLRAVCRHAPGRRVVYASTRQIYGSPQYLPVDERHPIAPPDFNGVHKYSAGQYHQLLGRTGAIDPVVLRLTNVFGPRMAIGLPCQGFLGVFTRRAISGQPIAVFGDGTQIRDPIYVDDAVDAFLRAGAVTRPERRVFNVGSSDPLTLSCIARKFCEAAGLPAPEVRPFPPGRSAIDVGGYTTDTACSHEGLGWRAETSFDTALQRTLDFYGAHAAQYLSPKGGTGCPLNHPA
jgi:UDP-glucose 4-epimerase